MTTLAAPPVCQRNSRLRRQQAEGEALFDIEAHLLGIVIEISNGEIPPDDEFEIAAAQGDHHRTRKAGRPDDRAFDDAADMLEDRITRFRRLGDPFMRTRS